MKILLTIWICVLINSLTSLQPPSCDDLFDHSQCQNLTMTQGNITLRGLNIVFFVYESDSSNQTMNPLILINGGPGASHLYLEPMKQIACFGRKIIMYDQAGNGESSIPKNISNDAPWLLTIPYYIEELQAIVDHLQLQNFYVLGHSWGSVVAVQYALIQPIGLKGLIIGGALADSQFYIQEQIKARWSTLPTFFQQELQNLTESQDFDSELYQQIDQHLTSFWTVRQFPIPLCVQNTNINSQIYVAMQGASEFTISGVLEYYNVTQRLHEIKYETLVTGGEFDTMALSTLEAIHKEIPNSQLKIFPRCGHITMVDEPNDYNKYVHEFLNNLESNKDQLQMINSRQLRRHQLKVNN